MKMPGFTAEVSLYQTRETYRQRPTGVIPSARPMGVIPSATGIVPAAGGPQCLWGYPCISYPDDSVGYCYYVSDCPIWV